MDPTATVPAGTRLNIQSDIIIDGVSTGEQRTYWATATDDFSNIDDRMNRRFVDLDPSFTSTGDIWLIIDNDEHCLDKSEESIFQQCSNF